MLLPLPLPHLFPQAAASAPERMTPRGEGPGAAETPEEGPGREVLGRPGSAEALDEGPGAAVALDRVVQQQVKGRHHCLPTRQLRHSRACCR